MMPPLALRAVAPLANEERDVIEKLLKTIVYPHDRLTGTHAVHFCVLPISPCVRIRLLLIYVPVRLRSVVKRVQPILVITDHVI